jgi:hypothetical protein
MNNLYKQLLRTAQMIPDIKERVKMLGDIRASFRAARSLTDPEEIEKKRKGEHAAL